ncbi:hypothetical protein AABB24_015658, partial [Solanum stoloniferum]
LKYFSFFSSSQRRAAAARPLSSPIALASHAKRQAPSSSRLLRSPLLSLFRLTNPAQPHPSLTPDPSLTGAATTGRATIPTGASTRLAAITEAAHRRRQQQRVGGSSSKLRQQLQTEGVYIKTHCGSDRLRGVERVDFEEAQHKKKLIQASFIKVGHKATEEAEHLKKLIQD